MRTREDAQKQMDAVWHEPDQSWAVSKLKGGFIELVDIVWACVPDGPEKTVVLRKLQEAAALASVAIVLTEE